MRSTPLPLAVALLAACLGSGGCASSAPAAAAASAAPVTSIATPVGRMPADPRRQIAWATRAATAGAGTTGAASAPSKPLLRDPARAGATTSTLALCQGRPRDVGAWLEGSGAGDVRSRWASAAFALGAVGFLSAEHSGTKEDLGDLLQLALPGAALATSTLQGDGAGIQQLALSFGTAMALTQALKRLVEKGRPDLRDSDSFPSGHTAASFAGAAFLHERYGPRLGMPAYVLASFTALTRVAARKHFLDDVIAGAGLGLMSTWLFVTPCCDAGSFEASARPDAFPWRLVFVYGAVLDPDDTVQAPKGVGTRFLLTEPGDKEARLASARVFLEYTPVRGHTFCLHVDPVDVAGVGTLSAPVTFGTTVFGAGAEVETRHHLHRYRLSWRYKLATAGPFTLEPGVGVLVTDYRAEVRAGGTKEVVAHLGAHPTFSLRVEGQIARTLRAQADVEGGALSDSHFLDASVQVIWQAERRWDVGLGYHYLDTQTNGRRIRSKLTTHEVFVAIGRSF